MYKLFSSLINIFMINLLFISFAGANSQELKLCYSAKALLLKVGESCISYKIKDEKLHIDSTIKTVNVGSFVRKVNDYGTAIISSETLLPSYFKFYQEEGNYKRLQEYTFSDNNVKVKKIRYVGLTDTIKKEETKEFPMNGSLEPYSLSLKLFKEIKNKKDGSIKLFYDNKFYEIPYYFTAEELLTVGKNKFDTYKILVKPVIPGKGLLIPKGDWYLWVDKETSLPIKMKVEFLIGFAYLQLDMMEGNKLLITNILDKSLKS